MGGLGLACACTEAPYIEVNASIVVVGTCGVRVRTEEGLIGMIPTRDLPSNAADLLPGETLRVDIVELRPENKFRLNPIELQDSPIILSWASVKRRELQEKYEEGDVVEAKVVGFFTDSMDVEIDGVPFPLEKTAITNTTSTWEFGDVFTSQEIVKVFWAPSSAFGILFPRSWISSGISMSALERVPGAVIHNKTKVFEEADETAKTAKKLLAWQRLERAMGQDMPGRKKFRHKVEINVSVAFVGPWGGASVRTEADLPGILPARLMGGTLDLKRGQNLTVQILELWPENKLTADPRRTRDYPIVCSWQHVRRRELCKKYHNGDVVEAKVVGLFADSMDVEIDGVHFPLRKDDITGATSQWEFKDFFTLREIVKVCWTLNDHDEARKDLRTSNVISMQVLEPMPGAILEDKAAVFEQAHENAARTMAARELAWEKAVKSHNEEEGTSPYWEVIVTNVFPWGASVRTEEGLIGRIPARELGSESVEPGQALTVEIVELRPENKFNFNPGRTVKDYQMVFSGASVKRRELCKKYNEGDVAEAKITKLLPLALDIEIDGVPFVVRKSDITGARKNYEIADFFEAGEIVKVYCLSSDGAYRKLPWSMRALEPEPGALLVDKAKVFAEAEETAKIFYENELPLNPMRTLCDDDGGGGGGGGGGGFSAMWLLARRQWARRGVLGLVSRQDPGVPWRLDLLYV